MKKVIKFAVILTLTSVVMTSCGNNGGNIQDSTAIEEITNAYPTITPYGIAPFLLGTYAPDIPQQGEWYDSYQINETFEVMYGMMGNITTVSAEELEEMKANDMINDIISESLEVIVMKGDEVLMRIECDDNKSINRITVCSPNIKLSNGICVGMTIDEIAKITNAKLLRYGSTTTDVHLELEIQDAPKNLEIHLADKNGLIRNSLWEAGFMDNWKEVSEDCYIIPLTDDSGDYIESMVLWF